MDPNTLTLRSWYEQHFVALFQADVRKRTIEEYSATLQHWESKTDNLPLQSITGIAISLFRATLAEDLSPATVNKHLRHLNHLLGKAGPAGPHNRDALGLLSAVPWVKQLRTYQRRPQAAGLPAIRQFYKACPDDWWRGFVVCAFHLGSRVRALVNVREADVDWGVGRITFTAEHDKRRIERTKPMSMCVRRHLVKLRGCGLLHLSTSKTTFYKAWHRIEMAAGFTEDEEFTPHALKRACGTQLASSGASPWSVKYMLDHSQSDVTGCSYVDPLEGLVDVVELLPDPSVGKDDNYGTSTKVWPLAGSIGQSGNEERGTEAAD